MVASVESGETFELSLESNYTMERVSDYIYRLNIAGAEGNDLGDFTVQWIFGQQLFYKYFTIFDLES